ncbi:DUF1499 domain-containing protein [Fodinicurvata halophila]|uniref:DUF1499 domain-containing protein n=1 Tax=Fodinicurvata halophila TaxID=1419723 RepID=A0ABV8UKH3_9PROT
MSTAQTDVLALSPPATPNWHVAAPDGVREDIAGSRSPLYPLTVAALRTSFRNIVLAQPRISCLYQAQAEREADIYEQRSPVFGFKDVIQVWSLQQNEQPQLSGLVIYSRALTGYYDFGVNRRRVRRWLRDLSRSLERTE